MLLLFNTVCRTAITSQNLRQFFCQLLPFFCFADAAKIYISAPTFELMLLLLLILLMLRQLFFFCCFYI